MQPVGPADQHRRVRCGEFTNPLAACPAGGAQHLAVTTGNRDGIDPATTGHHHGGDGAGLGTIANRIGGIFDIGTAMDAATLIEDGGADRKLRLGGVGLTHRGDRGSDQPLFLLSHLCHEGLS